MSEQRTRELLKYEFKPDELNELGATLARETQGVLDLKTEKAAATAAINARIKQADQRVSELATKRNNGYELREVEVMYQLEVPRPGMKRVIRVDTCEHLRDEPMTAAEMQASFGFPEPDIEG